MMSQAYCLNASQSTMDELYGGILDYLDKNYKSQELYHPAMVKLLRIDMTKGTDYAHTLYIYLTNERNNTLTAARLYLHRNTLSYRLRQISSLTNVDLEDEMVRSHLKLTYDLIAHNRAKVFPELHSL